MSTGTEELEEMEEVFVDFLNAVEAAIVGAKQQIAKLKKVETWDPSKIGWKQAEGSKGTYDRYPGEGEKAEATPDYKNMLADLKEHNGKLSRNGFFYWIFTDQATVGRKKRNK